MGDKEWEPQDILDVFSDETSRDIIALASVQPVTAEEIGDHLDLSAPTVYRRLNALIDYQLLREERHVESNGRQYRSFETTVKRVNFEVEAGEISVDIAFDQDLVERFEKFWDDFENLGGELSTEFETIDRHSWSNLTQTDG